MVLGMAKLHTWRLVEPTLLLSRTQVNWCKIIALYYCFYLLVEKVSVIKKISWPHFPKKHNTYIKLKEMHFPKCMSWSMSITGLMLNWFFDSNLLAAGIILSFFMESHMWCISGEVYTWGRDEGDGRLGLGSGGGPGEAGSMSVPSKVKALPVPVSAVACGGFFTLALTPCGGLWSWGGNKLNSKPLCVFKL